MHIFIFWVQHILSDQWDVILECKVCKSLFRSLANFTSHKRFYCKIDYAEVRFQTDSNVDISDTTELVQTEEVLEMVSQRLSDEATSSTSVPTASVKKKTLTRIVDKLVEKRGGVPVEGQSVFKPPINPTESFKKIQEVLANRNSLRLVNSVKLDRVNSNRNAVFQSVNGANINEDNNRLNQDENRIVEVVSSNEVTSNMDTEPPQPSENVDVELTSPKPKKGMDKSMLNEYMEISGTKPKCTKCEFFFLLWRFFFHIYFLVLYNYAFCSFHIIILYNFFYYYNIILFTIPYMISIVLHNSFHNSCLTIVFFIILCKS